MSYSGKRRYKNRRERTKIISKNTGKIIVGLLIAFAILAIKYRVAIVDYISPYFY